MERITVAELEGVREYNEDYPVELGRNRETNRIVLRAYNEGHWCWTEIDLLDLLENDIIQTILKEAGYRKE